MADQHYYMNNGTKIVVVNMDLLPLEGWKEKRVMSFSEYWFVNSNEIRVFAAHWVDITKANFSFQLSNVCYVAVVPSELDK